MRAAKAPLARDLERFQTRRLAGLLDPVLLDPALKRDQLATLIDYLRPELVHPRDDGAITLRENVQILVASYEIAEGLRGKHHLERVQRPPLVDLDQPLPQHRALDLHLVLRADQIRRGVFDFTIQGRELLVQRSNYANRRIVLAVDVRHFLADVMHPALDRLHAPLQLVALPPDTGELLLLRAQLRVGLLLCRERSCEDHRDADCKSGAPQMRLR